MPLTDIALLALDVDGVLTDGTILLAGGEEQKAFHVRDGAALKWLESAGVKVALISGRRSPAVERRARELGLTRVMLGQEDKLEGVRRLALELAIEPPRMGYVGDDLPDLPALLSVGFSATVPEAPIEVRSRVHYVTRERGGHGAVREIAELLLKARGAWDAIVARHLVIA